MEISQVLRGFLVALAFLTVLASEETSEGRKETTNGKILPILEASAKDEGRNGTGTSLDYSITVSMVNYGNAKAKVQQRYLFPNGVEVKSFTLQKDGYRSKRSTDNQKLTQWVGGTVDFKSSDSKEADLTYINHPSQVVNPNSKTFHKLSTTIMIKEGDLLGGKISSPNYPNFYPNGADLTWLIVYPEDNIVKLEMEDYATEECCDRVIVYDGYSKSHYPLATFEGDYRYSDNVVLSTQPAMFIRFTSDCLTTSRGFRASYINQRKSKAPALSCGNVQQINGNEGYIQSPNYPGTYDEYMNCTWPVQTYYNTRVKFVFDNFTIGSDDYVAIYEGTPNSPGSRIASLYGNTYSGYQVYASSNEAFVVFTSGYSSYYADMFMISYTGISDYDQATTRAPMSCGYPRYTGSDSGYIVSPNYPGSYDANMNCTWAVQTWPNTRVKFTLEYFYTGSDDQVSFYDGSPDDPGSFLRRLSGSYGNGYTISASSNQAFAVFTSGYYSYSYNKFNISYDGEYATPAVTTESYHNQSTGPIYYDPPQCNGDSYMSSNNGNLYSPGYNTPGYYTSNDNCIWYITTYTGYSAVKFYPYYFSTEYNWDWVRIYNYHSTSQNNLIAQVSGYIEPYTTLAVSNSMYATLTFDSDSSISDRGFKIRYYGTYYDDYTTEAPVATTPSALNNTCPYPYYSSYSGYVRSPNFPDNYYNNMNCTQWVNTPYGTTVRLSVESFQLNSGDYVEIYDGYTNNFLSYMSGSYSYGYSRQAATNYIRIVFVSDSYYTSTGYSLRYEGVDDWPYYTTASPESPDSCGGSMPFNYGFIISPNFPAAYTNYLDCVWTVTVHSNMYVLFTVEYFSTESCCDYAAFYSGTPSNISGMQVDRLEGYVSKGHEIDIPDYQAWISFHTDYSVTYPGFNITYQPVATDFILTNSTNNGYGNVTQGYDTTQWMRREVQPENKEPKTLGKDLWGNKQKPAHLRKEKMEEQRDDDLN